MADSPASASSLGTAGAGGTVTVPAPSSGGDSKTGTGSGNARPTITTTPIRQRAWWERVAQFILVFQIGNLFALFVAFGLFWYAVFWYLDITIPRWILIVGAVAYLGHMSMADTHLKGGREWEAFRRGFRTDNYWVDLITDYFPSRILNPDVPERTLDLDKQPVFFAVHPHGIHCFPFIFLTLCNTALRKGFNYRKVVGLVATVIFYVPIMREIFFWAGYRDVRRACATSTLAQGLSVCVVVGGEAETLENINGRDRVVLGGRGRHGFIRLCITAGVPVVPVYGYGTSDTYRTFRNGAGYRFRRWISKVFKICIPIFYGRWFTPMPLPQPISVVFGEPLSFGPKQSDPSPEYVAECHARYVTALRELYDRYKNEAGYPDRQLEVLDA